MKHKEYWYPAWKAIPVSLQFAGGPNLELEISDQLSRETDSKKFTREVSRLYQVFRPDSLYQRSVSYLEEKIRASSDTQERLRLVCRATDYLTAAVMGSLDWTENEKTIGWLQRCFEFVNRCTDAERESALKWLSSIVALNNEALDFYLIDQMTHPRVPDETKGLILSGLELSTTHHSVALSLRLGLTSGLADKHARRALGAARRGLPDSCRALRDYLNSADQAATPEERASRLAYVSSVGGYAGEFWGDFCLTIFERPLRLLEESGLSVAEAHRTLAPSISRSIFLFIYGLADGDPIAIGEINAKFERVNSKIDSPEFRSLHDPELIEGRLVERDICFKKLKLAFIQAAFFPSPLGRKSLAEFDELYAGDKRADDESWEKAKIPVMYEIQRYSNYIESIATDPRWDAHELQSCRLALRRQQNPTGIEISEIIRRFGTNDPKSDKFLASIIQLDPVHPGDDALNSGRGELLFWEAGEGGKVPLIVSQFEEAGVERRSIRMLMENDILTAARVFLRAHTIKGNHDLVAMLADATNHMDPPNFEKWRGWRYGSQNLLGSYQMWKLKENGTECHWIENQLAVCQGLYRPDNRQDPAVMEYCWYFTDDPLFLFSLGNIPKGQRSCSAYDGGTYYSRSLVSYVCDAHIKAGILISIPLLRYYSPELYQKFKDRTVRPNELSRYRTEIIASSVRRTVIKVGWEQDLSAPALLCEPSFLVGESEKKSPTDDAQYIEFFVGRKIGAQVYLDPRTPGEKSSIVIPQSVSPAGQVENWDGKIWLATQKASYSLQATRVAACPPEGPPGLLWHVSEQVESRTNFGAPGIKR